MALNLDLVALNRTERHEMSVYEIGILLHYYSRADEHEDAARQPPVWEPTVQWMVQANLLKALPKPNNFGKVLDITNRGRLYVDALKQVPLPESIYIVNWPTDPLCCKRDGSEG